MYKYCPICLNEFRASISNCPEDHVALVDKKPAPVGYFKDVYRVDNEIEAERLLIFLREEGIEARESETGISQLPVISEEKFVISVLEKQKKSALDLIRLAISDGIISDKGAFL